MNTTFVTSSAVPAYLLADSRIIYIDVVGELTKADIKKAKADASRSYSYRYNNTVIVFCDDYGRTLMVVKEGRYGSWSQL